MGGISFALAMPGFDYRYELRQGEEIVATGHLTQEQPLGVGDRIVIGTTAGTVRNVEPVLGERELRLACRFVGRIHRNPGE